MMKVITSVGVTLTLIILICTSARGQGGARSNDELLTNASVVKLVRAGFSDKSVIAIVRKRPARFNLASEQLIELKKNGVSERVILAMLARDEARAANADDWGDDSSFGDSGSMRPRGGAGGAASEPGETNIFGSSGGSRGRTRSRGSNGGVNDNDIETQGSASVRILRPPTEAGGAAAAPRLERTPTLTNNSIIELVEAGFTDGTIIRRIEASPADFDFSPSKLTELQRRRVSPAVIAAMRAAAGETNSPSGNPAPR
ncbi:MAG: hypothetical protein WKF74_01690 [Pyrinomonadaceae bacterium]